MQKSILLNWRIIINQVIIKFTIIHIKVIYIKLDIQAYNSIREKNNLTQKIFVSAFSKTFKRKVECRKVSQQGNFSFDF